jgi:hypothetical protein
MRVVPLAATPNQSFTSTIDGVRWGLAIKAINGAMVCDVARNGAVLLSGVRALAGEAIIPYAYLADGNFLFLTAADAMPDWRLFGVSQLLVYMTAAEIEALPAPLAYDALKAFNPSPFIFTDGGLYITTDSGEYLEHG